MDAGLRGVPGRPEPGDVVRQQPDPLHEPGPGRVLHQLEGRRPGGGGGLWTNTGCPRVFHTYIVLLTPSENIYIYI